MSPFTPITVKLLKSCEPYTLYRYIHIPSKWIMCIKKHIKCKTSKFFRNMTGIRTSKIVSFLVCAWQLQCSHSCISTNFKRIKNVVLHDTVLLFFYYNWTESGCRDDLQKSRAELYHPRSVERLLYLEILLLLYYFSVCNNFLHVLLSIFNFMF